MVNTHGKRGCPAEHKVKEEISRPATVQDLKKLIHSLNDNNVEYMLIGGYALYAHGMMRMTTDIDLLVPKHEEAGKKLLEALLVLPDKAAKGVDLAWFKEGDTIRLADEIVVDIMFNAGGESFESLKDYAEVIDFEGVPIKTVNIEGLLKTKQTLRDKDRADKMVLSQALAMIRKQIKPQ
jgi:predicted nucleotidyltransferase